MDLLGLALDGLAEWRVVSASTLLPHLAGMPAGATLAEKSRLARSVGAGTLILGRVVGDGPDLTITAELFDTRRPGRVASASARGKVGNPGPIIDSLATALAKQRLSTSRHLGGRPLEDYGTASPSALRAYLVAEQLRRAGEYQTAWDSLRKSIERDSTFAMAWYKLLQTAWWGNAYNDFGRFDPLIKGARRDTTRLPRRIRLVLHALQAADRGQRLEALRRADDLFAAYPEDPDAILASADNYYHFGLPSGEPPGPMIAAFESVTALDPGVLEPYFHLYDLQCQFGDTTRAWQAYARRTAKTPGWGGGHVAEIAMRAMYRHESPASLFPQLPEADLAETLFGFFSRLLMCGDRDPARTIALTDSFMALAAGANQPRPVRLTALQYRYDLALARGAYERAWGFLQEALALDETSPAVHERILRYHLVTGMHNPEASKATERLATMDRGVMLRLWQNALRGTLDSPKSRDLYNSKVLSRPDYPEYRDALMAGLKGLLQLNRGDTVGAQTLLLRAYEMRDPDMTSRPWETPDRRFSLALARIEMGTGNLQAASRRLYDSMLPNGVYERAEAEELRGQIEEQRSDTTAALRAYHTFIALWEHADSQLQPRVTAARAAVARLGHN